MNERKVEHWECPTCKYLVTDTEYLLSRYDYECPRCKESNLSEFHCRLEPKNDNEENKQKK